MSQIYVTIFPLKRLYRVPGLHDTIALKRLCTVSQIYVITFPQKCRCTVSQVYMTQLP